MSPWGKRFLETATLDHRGYFVSPIDHHDFANCLEWLRHIMLESA